MGKPWADRVQTVRIFSCCLKIVGRISEPAQKKRGQKVLLVLGEQMRQFARVARGQSGQLFSLVLGEKVRRVALCKNPDRLICPDRQGQDRAYGRTVDARRRHRLSEHSTPRKIDNAAPCAPAVHRLPYQSAAACRKDNAAAPKRAPCHACARPRFALLFRLERTRKGAFRFGHCLPRQAFWSCPRPRADRVSGRALLARSSARLQRILSASIVFLFDARHECLARRSRTSALLVPRTPQPVPKT